MDMKDLLWRLTQKLDEDGNDLQRFGSDFDATVGSVLCHLSEIAGEILDEMIDSEADNA